MSAIGSLLGVCAATPAFAAALDAIPLGDPSLLLRDALLMASAVLLATALVLRIRRRRHGTEHDTESMPTGPDLRWWKQQEA